MAYAILKKKQAKQAMQTTCHLQAHISPTTTVAEKSGNVFFP
jgi:hypothetical protein